MIPVLRVVMPLTRESERQGDVEPPLGERIMSGVECDVDGNGDGE